MPTADITKWTPWLYPKAAKSTTWVSVPLLPLTPQQLEVTPFS